MARLFLPDSLAGCYIRLRSLPGRIAGRLAAASVTPALLLGTVLLAGCATPALTPEGSPARAEPAAAPAVTAPASTSEPERTASAPARSAEAAVRSTSPIVLPPRLQYGPVTQTGLLSLHVDDPLVPRTLDLTRPADDVWTRIRNGFAVPNLISPLVVDRQAWYLARSEYFLRTVERSSIYLYHIVEELEKRGMPTELALLPFIESAYNPMALSTSRASGIWQFIPSTGKQYNLKQDWWRDERRDIIASTEAALTYLQTIYEMHGDWHLALASYNWGEGAVKRAIEKNRALGLPTDYLNLSMPDETRYYIPKLQAVKNIIAHPELFNLALPKVQNQPYFTMVQKKRDLDIRTAARLAEMPLADFRALNPSFNRPVMTGQGNLLLPTGKSSVFESNLASHNEALTTWKPYTMQRNDQIEKVAKKFGMSVAALREINGMDPTVRIRPGQTVLVRAGGADIPASPAATATNPPGKLAPRSVQKVGKEAPRVAAKPAAGSAAIHTYVVKRGDTLYAISQKFGVTVEQLKSLNGLKKPNIAAGHKLRVSN